MGVPIDMLVPIVATDMGITPGIFTSLYNTGQTHLFVNFIGTAVNNRRTGSIEIPPGGYLPNLELNLSNFSAISDITPGRLLIMQSKKPMELAKLNYDNPIIIDDFNYTAVNDNANAFYAHATLLALGGTRITVVVVEAVTNDVLMTFNGTAPNRIGFVGSYLAAGDAETFTVDAFVDLLAMNAVALSNVNIRGTVYAL